jgi:hypothetical protein
MKYPVIKIISLTILLLLSVSALSQDLIVTIEGDSLNCKINKIDSKQIYFTFQENEEVKSTSMPLDQITYHQFKYDSQNSSSQSSFPRFRAAISGGWSYRVGKISKSIPDDLRDYTKNLKSGTGYGIDLSYFASEEFGFGIKYSAYLSKNQANIVVSNPDGSSQSGKMSDNISIVFVGPTITSRSMNINKRNSLVTTLGIGYLGYNDEAVLITDLKIKGSTIGFCGDITYDLGLSDSFAIGIQLSYKMGTLMKYKVSRGSYSQTIKLDKDNYESLNHIDLSLGLRFNK